MENITIWTDRGLLLGKNCPLTTLGAHVAKLSLTTTSLSRARVGRVTPLWMSPKTPETNQQLQ